MNLEQEIKEWTEVRSKPRQVTCFLRHHTYEAGVWTEVRTATIGDLKRAAESAGYLMYAKEDIDTLEANLINTKESLAWKARAEEAEKKLAEYEVRKKKCPVCLGTGEYRTASDYQESCPACDGLGYLRA
jgi:hypothetical protein